MIKWLKDLFKPSETGRMVPISQIEADRAREKREEQEAQDEILDIESQIKEYDEINEQIREYVYVGDGMMEEVTRVVPKTRSHVSSTQAVNRSSRSASTSSSYQSSSSTPYIYGGSDYDSGSSYSSYDSGSCDSSSSSCD